MAFERELAAVQRWVDETDPIAMRHFAPSVATETKSDGTPVTVADRAIEAALRERIEQEFPGDAIVGEEAGTSGEGARRWIIDPIDGTSNYSRGIPAFGTLIAFEHEDDLSAAIVSAPALRTRWWATRGGGAFRDGNAIAVSLVASLANAQIGWGELIWAHRLGWLERFGERGARQRAFADFWGHMLVAQGSMEVMLEPAPIAIWDTCAPKLIVEEAGGRWTSPDGDAKIVEGACVVSNSTLHDETLKLLRVES